MLSKMFRSRQGLWRLLYSHATKAAIQGSTACSQWPFTTGGGQLQQRTQSSPSILYSPEHGKVNMIRPYEEIPGPKGLPLIGTVMDYSQDKYRRYKVMRQRVKQYGRLYREKIIPGLPEMVFVSDPADIEKVFRAEAKYPRRATAFGMWMQAREKAGIPPGIFHLDGKEWHQQRAPISKFISVPRKVGEYHEGFNEVALDLLKRIRFHREEGSNMVNDVSSHLFKWSLESASLFIVGKRLGALELGRMSPDTQELIDGLQEYLHASQLLMFGLPVYKLWPTRQWKRLLKAQEKMYTISMTWIDEKMKEIQEDESAIAEGEDQADSRKVDFLTYIIHTGQMNLENITSNTFDLINAAINNTSLTLLWTLYCLATHPDAQEKLYREIQSVVGSEDLVTPQHINNMPYLKAVIKESQRLYPVAPMNSRTVEEDIILSYYHIPKGTTVVMPLLVTGRLPEIFPEPDRFLPERWSNKTLRESPNVFATLPYGFGQRNCVGWRLAEFELRVALSQIIKNFRVEFNEDTPIGVMEILFLNPEREMKLIFRSH